jgi:hypothetical protein
MLFKGIWLLISYKKIKIVSSDIYYHTPTENQKKTFLPVLDALSEKGIKLIGLHNFLPPPEILFIYGLRRFNDYINGLFAAAYKDKFKLKVYLNTIPYLLVAVGTYEFFRKNLKGKTSFVILSNDHYRMSRAILYAAKSLNIRTIYIPHASVSFQFPPIEFDLSLLEGEDMLKKYQTITKHKFRYKLAGIPKLDKFLSQADQPKQESVGVCINTADNTGAVIGLIEYFNLFLSQINIVFRPHPNDQRNWQMLLKTYNNIIKISSASEESSLEFLRRQKAIISGPSNIILEAVLLNVLPIQYKFNETPHLDNYGFIKKGIVKLVEDKQELVDLLRSGNLVLPEKSQRMRNYYCATIGTELEGRSTEFAANAILEFMGKKIEEVNQ